MCLDALVDMYQIFDSLQGVLVSSSEVVDKTHPSLFKGCTSDSLLQLISSYQSPI